MTLWLAATATEDAGYVVAVRGNVGGRGRLAVPRVFGRRTWNIWRWGWVVFGLYASGYVPSIAALASSEAVACTDQDAKEAERVQGHTTDAALAAEISVEVIGRHQDILVKSLDGGYDHVCCVDEVGPWEEHDAHFQHLSENAAEDSTL